MDDLSKLEEKILEREVKVIDLVLQKLNNELNTMLFNTIVKESSFHLLTREDVGKLINNHIQLSYRNRRQYNKIDPSSLSKESKKNLVEAVVSKLIDDLFKDEKETK